MPYKDQDQQRAFQLNWITARRKKYIEQLGCCFFCGSHDNIQPHHIDPDEKWSHRIWSYADDKIDLELRKCIALCEPCHTKFHMLLRRIKVKHGTQSGYRAGCRCLECKAAKSNRRRELKSVSPA